MSVRVMLWVQHLVGVGHQQRSAALARALATRGAEVRYLSGGLPLPDLDLSGCDFVQLPPARSLDMRYHTLVDEHGTAVDEAWRERRAAMLMAQVASFRPQVVITETWPFGRGLLRFELEPLMAQLARLEPRPLVLCSIRDLVEPRRQVEKVTRMRRRVEQYFHAVLVHGDPALIPFDVTFAQAPAIAPWLRYTGYVCGREVDPPPPERERRGVLVSAGGGFFGERLLETALRAAAADTARSHPWHVLVGPNLPQERFDRLVRMAAPGVCVERNRADFPALLQRAAVSVSQAGYNTVTDLLASQVPAVLVPYRDEREFEQDIRARYLAQRALVQRVDYEALAPATLLEAVRAAQAAGDMPDPGIRLDGAARGADLVLAMVAGDEPVATPLDAARAGA